MLYKMTTLWPSSLHADNRLCPEDEKKVFYGPPYTHSETTRPFYRLFWLNNNDNFSQASKRLTETEPRQVWMILQRSVGDADVHRRHQSKQRQNPDQVLGNIWGGIEIVYSKKFQSDLSACKAHRQNCTLPPTSRQTLIESVRL